jgi:hypothetical protein
VIKPARGKFVKWLKEKKIGHNGYYGGWEVGPKGEAGMSQSMERKSAYCRAFAEVLEKEAGLTAYTQSRMD